MSLRRQVLSGVIWYGGGRVLVQVITSATMLIVARHVAPSEYGLLGMALVYLGFVDLINELGFGAAIVQRDTLAPEDLDTLFWVGFVASLGLYGFTLLLAPAVADFFRQPLLVNLLTLVGLSLVLTGLSTVPWNLITRAVDFRRRAIVEVMSSVSGALVTLWLALADKGVWALAVGMLLAQGLTTIGAFYQARWRPRWRVRLEALKRHLSFSLAVAGGRAAWALHSSADSLVIGRVLGDQALGVYSVANRIGVEMPARVVQVINQVAFPAYSRIQGDPALLLRYFLKSMQLVALASLPTSLGVALVAPDFVPLILTEKWHAIVVPLQLLSVGAIPRTLQSLAGPLVVAKGHPKVALRFNLLCLALLPPSYLLGAQRGVVGVAFIWVTLYPSLTAYWVMRTRPLIGYTWTQLWECLRPAVLASGVMVAGVLLVRVSVSEASHASRLGASIVAGVLAYGIALRYFAPALLGDMAEQLRTRTRT